MFIYNYGLALLLHNSENTPIAISSLATILHGGQSIDHSSIFIIVITIFLIPLAPAARSLSFTHFLLIRFLTMFTIAVFQVFQA